MPQEEAFAIFILKDNYLDSSAVNLAVNDSMIACCSFTALIKYHVKLSESTDSTPVDSSLTHSGNTC